MKLKPVIARLSMLAVAVALATNAANAAKPAFFDKQGIKVLSESKGPGGLTAWKVDRNGVQTVFYTTADGNVLISGVLWDAANGKNLSDAFMTGLVNKPTAAASQLQSKWDGKVPEQIKGIARLSGVKEGSAPLEKTLYIVFDPRCPHCHAVYQKTRSFIAKGGTIKWLPVTVLGRPDEGARLVAEVMQDANPVKALATVMNAKRPGLGRPDKTVLQAISENESYFWAAFERNKNAGEPGVPVAFFMAQNGSPQMVAGIDDDALLAQIFNDIKK